MVDLTSLKAEVRAILLTLGRRATEREFRQEFYNLNEKRFSEVLKELGFFDSLPFFMEMAKMNVCRISYTNGEMLIHYVACEETSHMTHLTIVKKKKKNTR